MSVLTTPDTSQAKIRFGYEADCNVPAAPGAMTFFPPFQSTDVDPEKVGVPITNIAGSGHAAQDLPGKATVVGTTAAQADADGMLAAVANALRGATATTALGGGAHQTTYGRSHDSTNAVPSYSMEVDRNDGVHSLHVGGETTEFTVTIANNAAMIVSTTHGFAYSTTWRTAVERHPNPATGSLYIRGLPQEWIDRADGNAGDLYFRLVDQFVDTAGVTQNVFLGINGRPGPITGTWTVGAGTNAFASVAAGAALTDLEPGDIIDVAGQLVTVATITDDDTFTTTENHTAGAAGATVNREYGEAGAAGITFFQTVAGNSTQTSLPRWGKAKHSSGGFMGQRATAGSTIETHLTATTGIVPGVAASLTGTVSVAASDATVTGVGTDFVAELRVGDFVTTPGDTVGKRVLSITSTTAFEADSNYDAIESGVTMTRRPIPTVALTGTVTTAAADATLVGVGTLFTTELAVGSWIRTAGGVVRRVLSITDNLNLEVTEDYTGIESGVALTTDYEWQVQRERADWAATTHASGLFPELLSELHVFLSTTTLPEEQVEIAETLTFTYTAGKGPRGGIGSEHSAGVFDIGFSTGTVSMTALKVSAQLRKAIMTQQLVRIRVVASTGVLISTSPEEYTWEWIMHAKPTGKPAVVPDATANLELFNGGLFDNSADPDGFVDALTLRVTSDDSTPLAVA